MVKNAVGAIALATLPSALAFRNTSPFFLFSSAKLSLPSTDGAIASSAPLLEGVKAVLEQCPTESYIVVEQAGVSSNDYIDDNNAPNLSLHMRRRNRSVNTVYSVPEVVGQIDSHEVANFIQKSCGVKTKVHALKAPSANPTSRKLDLLTADDTLGELIYAAPPNYTVIYLTTPPSDSALQQSLEEHPPYEMDASFDGQMELKRDISSHVSRASNASDNAGLFGKYQYFTPGLFMGFAAIIPLFAILLVGVRALTSLEVSYFAFSKEMGPNAQKKQ